MNKKVTKVVAATVGTAMFAGMLVSGVGASAKQVEAKENNSIIAGTGSTWVNFMSVTNDNGTNIQVFKTDYGYGAWATDSNGNIIGDEPVAKTPYYIPGVGTKGRDTDYGSFVAAYEVDIYNTAASFGIPGGNTIQTYYSVADFAQNVTDHYDHFANALPIWQNDYTSSASLDEKGKVTTPYIFEFDFGDYNPYYVEFVGTTFSPTNKNIVDNTQIGVWTDTKWPDFGSYADYYEYGVDADGDAFVTKYIPEVYMNPVFEDAMSLATSDGTYYGIDAESILVNEWGDAGQVIPDEDGDFFDRWNGYYIGEWGSLPEVRADWFDAE